MCGVPSAGINMFIHHASGVKGGIPNFRQKPQNVTQKEHINKQIVTTIFWYNYMFFFWSLWIFRESSGFTVAICRWYGSWAFTTLTSPKRMTIGRARHAAEADRGFSDGAAGAWYHAQEMRSVCNMMQHCIHENFLKHGWPTIRNLYVLYVSVNVDKMISKYQFHRSIVDMMWWDI